MSIGHTLLGLLESGPRHGYDLKRTFDEKFGQDRPLHYGQVYSTMSRLLKNGLVEVDGVESEGGPSASGTPSRTPGSPMSRAG